jgi:hypothetical protein
MTYIPRESDNVSPDELGKPEIKIIQGTTSNFPAGGKQGQLFNTQTGQLFDNFEFVWCDRKKERIYWGRDSTDNTPPACSSDNADSMVAVDGTDCKTCPHRLDNPGAVTQEVRKTKCVVQYTIFGLTLPNFDPFMLRVIGMSIKPYIDFFSAVNANKALRDEGNHIMWHLIKIPISTAPTLSAKGQKTYALKFGSPIPLNTEDANLTFNMVADALGHPEAILQIEGGEETVENTTPALPAPKITEIPVKSQAEKDAETLYEGNKGTPTKVFIGWLATGKEIYAGDLVPAGAVILKEKPTPKPPAPVTTPPAAIKPPAPPVAPPKPPASTGKPAQININDL